MMRPPGLVSPNFRFAQFSFRPISGMAAEGSGTGVIPQAGAAGIGKSAIEERARFAWRRMITGSFAKEASRQKAHKVKILNKSDTITAARVSFLVKAGQFLSCYTRP
jgi:hypothetical protein